MSEIVVTGIRVVIVVGFAIVLGYTGTFVRMYIELTAPIWKGVRRWIGQVVIDAGCYVIRIGARLSGFYIARFVMETPKKLEISYE